MTRLNEPASWREHDGAVSVVAKPGADFWRKTHCGFERDSGHFLGTEVSGGFNAEVTVAGKYRALYDQAGLMERVSESVRLKCGIEFVDDAQHAGAVVMRDHSDWSVSRLPDSPASVRFRVARRGDALEMSWARRGDDWTLLRLAYLPMGPSVLVGPMAASPGDQSFEVDLSDWKVDPAPSDWTIVRDGERLRRTTFPWGRQPIYQSPDPGVSAERRIGPRSPLSRSHLTSRWPPR